MSKQVLLSLSAVLAFAPAIRAQQEPSPLLPQSAPAQVEAWSNTEVIRLPKFVVRRPEDPVFDERDIFTKGGFDALLVKRFPGASFQGQPAAMDNYAQLMYADEVRLERLSRYQGWVDLLRDTGDIAGSDALQADLYRTFVRCPTWRAAAMDRNVNGGRR
jgi:hypothetical protein